MIADSFTSETDYVRESLNINLPKPDKIVYSVKTKDQFFGMDDCYDYSYEIWQYNNTDVKKLKESFDWSEAVPIQNNVKINTFLATLNSSYCFPKDEQKNLIKNYPNFSEDSLFYEVNNLGDNNEGNSLFMILDPKTSILYLFERYW